MPKRGPTTVQLDRLAELRADPPPGDELLAELHSLLGAKSAHVVAKAAALVADLELGDLVPELREAFEERMNDSVRRDPQCAAKTAVAHALVRLEDADDAVFLRGIRHVQLEPVYGGKVDTAAELRGVCGIGLAAAGAPGALLEIVRLLADPETQTRVLGARAVAASGLPGSEEVLRLKTHTGDSEREVLVEAFLGLLRIAPERSLAFARDAIAADAGGHAEAAVLALGESRVEGAFEALAAAWEAGQPEPATVLLALATLRTEAAIELLCSVIADRPAHLGREALRALAVYRDDERLVERVRRAVAESGETSLRNEARRLLGS